MGYIENQYMVHFEVNVDNKGIALLSLASPHSVSIEWMEEFVAISKQIISQDTVLGLVYQVIDTGAEDYKSLFELAKVGALKHRLQNVYKDLLYLQSQPKPIAAVLSEKCEGSLFSWSLWAHYRVGSQDAKSNIHLPEMKFGLLPSYGAVSNVLRLNTEALSVITQSNSLTQLEGLNLGIINALAPTQEDRIRIAKQWILDHENWQHETINKQHEGFSDALATYKKRANLHYPNVRKLLNLLEGFSYSSAQTLLDQEIEAIIDVLQQQETLNMVRTYCYGVLNATQVRNNPHQVRKVGVLGAGMMGSGIAYEFARAGVEVILKDVSLDNAERGKSYARQVTSKLVSLNKLSTEEQENIINRIHPSDSTADLQNSDLIIEAVFEDKKLKSEVTKEATPYLSNIGIFASNTTSLPIADLAKSFRHPSNFLGLHFFSPVDRMALVEVIVGKDTSEDTLSKSLDVVKSLGKIPIVVHDSPAFFTSRIFFNYLLEAITMLLEGVDAEDIEKSASKAGFAIGPLAVLDEISIPLMLHVYDQLPNLHAAQQRAYNYLESLVSRGRIGRKAGKGFYDYQEKNKKIWKDDELKTNESSIHEEEIRKRLLHVMALDSYRCLEEGVLTKAVEGDLGSVMGVGFAAHTGGVFSYIDLIGIDNFVSDCKRFECYGEQWIVPSSLEKLKENKHQFYTDFKENNVLT